MSKSEEVVFIVEGSSTDGYTARAMHESIFTEADDLPSLREMIRDAVRCHFSKTDLPKRIRLSFAQKEVVDSQNVRQQADKAIPTRSEISPGQRVSIVEKQNQSSGKLTEGIVARILTKSPSHPHGIKVMLQDGRVGRVQVIA